MKKTLITLFVIVFCIFFGSWYYLYHIAPYAIIKPVRSDLTYKQESNPHHWNLDYQVYFITSFDSIKLKVWYIPANLPQSNVNIILLHGISGSKESNLKFAYFLSKNGYNVILPDLRAHGESEGDYCTYGYYEKKDISAIIDFFEANLDNKPIFGIWGSSLGGAIALQCLEYNNRRLKFGIIESTFASLDEIVRDYMEQMSGVGFKEISDLALENAEKIASFDAHQVVPEESAKHIYQPVLYIHGTNDKKINIKYGKRIYASLASFRKEFYPVKYAGHLNVADTGGKDYYNKILNFIKTVTIIKEKSKKHRKIYKVSHKIL